MKEIESFEDYYITEHGDVYSYKGITPRKMKLATRADGYVQVTLRKNKQPVSIMVHRLVALAYIDNPYDKPCINHIDGVKSNNCVSNLEWCTHKENTGHAFNIGLIERIGEGSDFCSTSEDKVRACCEMLQDNTLSDVEISNILCIGKDVVSKIKRRESWVHISKNYKLPAIRQINASMSEEDVKQICDMLNSGVKALHIARDLGIDRNVVNRIKYGKSYKDISKKYLHEAPTTIENA